MITEITVENGNIRKPLLRVKFFKNNHGIINVKNNFRSLLVASGLTLAFATSGQADEKWRLETIEVKSEGQSVMVPAAMFSGEEDYSVYFYREPEGAEFEKVWILFSLDNDAERLISSRNTIEVEVDDYTGFNAGNLKDVGEDFYWQSLRNVGVRIWDGMEYFPYSSMMKNIIDGETLRISYTTVNAESLTHEVNLSAGKELLFNTLRVEENPANEEGKIELQNSHQEIRKACTSYLLENEMKEYEICLTAMNTCLPESNGNAQLFEGCFNDLFRP